MEQLKGYIAGDGYLNICSMRKKNLDFYDFFDLRAPDGTMLFGKYLNDKMLIDAEVLMSAVYHKMGVNTPMYLPFMERNQMGVVSENVVHHDSTARTIAHIQQGQNKKVFGDFYIYNLIHNKDLQKLVTENAINQLIKMTHLDIASKNTDRSSYNLFLGDNRNGIFNSAISIDYGATADKFAKFHSGQDNYYIHMTQEGKGRYEYICHMCAVQDWYRFITPMEFIKETYGYEIDRRYVDYIDYCYKNFIEETNNLLSKS